MANNEADEELSSITIQTQLSLTTILAHGLMFFTALTIRDYMVSNVSLFPNEILPKNQSVRELVKLIITLFIVACLLVAINRWKKKIETDERRRVMLNK